ncbi:type III secretion system stator protein SctL [Pseudomonas synxantha]|uniref:Type III secretion apparatus protein RspE n=1 Tax=Pseudomonas synxantha TaxID=47883 RepID=A0AAX3I355_9PSED|nr:type III secretion system stator protein SctL [Pseudomonas synxantha]AZE64949.1 Type III secretion cytoplasmic protein (YscL) [Pseudomonas synxantha]KRP49930.1 type III secretion protein [Pseudomonas synxantha]MBI6563866.1 type III secretion system stator protein SctL [Pseudomonas synxantha]MBI6581102.1 type III secretion system stator protein SctL [Pseudomonas synxantha]MBI6642288.1 type III secretion system stator protein SctL [Pseudomonas synxantha]
MLTLRRIELHNGAPGQPKVLITREMLADCSRAGQLLGSAQAQADELLHQAAEHREELLEQASLDFWSRANAQLSAWERQRQAMCDNLEHYATSIANQAFHCLLEEVPQPQRLSALIKQLVATQIPPIKATLVCHPLEHDHIAQALAKLDSTLWRLRPDDQVKPQTLLLETDEGDFRIDWASMREILFASA